jgi:hypothetical protein
VEEAVQQTTQAPPSPSPKALLSKEARSKIMSEAATRRWAKAKKAKAKPKAALRAAPKKAAGKAPAVKRPAAPREFSSALKTAEKRLARAILERSEAAAKYAVLSAEIPSLQQLIVALSNPLGVAARAGVLAPTLEQIVGDQAVAYQNPPRREVVQQLVPQIPVPQPLHPANSQGRASGGAVGVDLGEDEDDENKFLTESGVAGGQWH